jgi:phenylacetate-CoA ligase
VVDRLHGQVLIPAFEAGLKRRSTFAYWRALEQSQWWSREQIEALQLERLRRLLAHAAATCPAYRDSWAVMGLDPAGVRTMADLARWPITDKATRRTHRDGIRSQAPGLRMLSKGTSGSSGEPFVIDYDEGSLQRRMAAAFRGYAWAGAPPGAKQFYFWGEPLFPRTARARYKDRLHHWLYRRHLHNSLNFRDDAVEDVLRRYEAARAEVVVAFTRPLYEWARVMHARGLRPTPPRALIVGAEKLYDFQRALLEEVFAAPVFETYGSREVMLIGAECDRHDGLHMTSEHLVVDIVDEDGQSVGPGVEGRLVVTDLFNYGAPFVRYDLGDRAVASARTCECGRGLPLLERVVGRQVEVMVTPDGRRVPGETFAFLFKDQFEVARYQAVQESATGVVLSVELRQPWPSEVRAQTVAALRTLLGDQMTIHLRIVDAIEDGPGGKLGLVRNPWLAAQRARETEAGRGP